MSGADGADESAGSGNAASPHARAGLWLRAPMEITVAGATVSTLQLGVISSALALAVVLAATERMGAAFGTLVLTLFMWAMTTLSWTTGRSVLRSLESDLHNPDCSLQQALRGR